jgi:hypothetical protein
MSITNGVNFDSGSKELNDRINEWLKWDKVILIFLLSETFIESEE